MIMNLINLRDNKQSISRSEHTDEEKDHVDQVANPEVRLAQEIEAVHDIFVNMALLVDNQGEQIDNIQTNIETTNTHVGGAKIQLIKAKKYQKRTRNCMCRICIVVVGVLFGIIIIILLTSVPISTGKN